ncbi:MAG: proton-conducting transporter membrane subunit [Candidatus Nezhaarchaeota archaeon]|nr:proton-conducting transporter membrane subunit [Candidatus Nezhaarchaeota archaeon]
MLVEIPLILQPLTLLFIGAALTPLIEVAGAKLDAEKLRDVFAIAVLALALFKVYELSTAVLLRGPLELSLAPPGSPIGSMLRADALSAFMALIFCILGLLVAIFSIRYMEEDSGLDKYYALLLTMVAGMVGVVLSWDFLTLFVFWETMCISGYVLVGFRKYKWEPVEAGFKYLVMSTFGSVLMFYGASFLLGLTGSLNFTHIAEKIETVASPALYLALCMIVVGFGITAAMVPFHTWLPDAHPAAPSGISAMLSGVVIKAGVYGMCRSAFTIFNPALFNYGAALMLFGVATLTVANLMALLQRDIKRLFAYSSIVNIGYIVTAGGIAAHVLTSYYSSQPAVSMSIATFALAGALFHVFNHAVGKGLLFLCTGCFLHEARTRDLLKLEGIGKRMPWTGASLSIGLLALAGVPPLNGFWSKLFIILAGLSMPSDALMTTATVILILNAVFAAAYYLWVMQRIMLKQPTERASKAHEVPLTMALPVVVMAAICVVVGVFPAHVLELADAAAKSLLAFVRGGLIG